HESLVQLPLAQSVPPEQVAPVAPRQAPWSSQVHGWLAHEPLLASQVPASSAPFTTAASQVPSFDAPAASEHAEHSPSQAVSQQTSSTQFPLLHCSAAVQAAPSSSAATHWPSSLQNCSSPHSSL